MCTQMGLGSDCWHPGTDEILGIAIFTNTPDCSSNLLSDCSVFPCVKE